jgi:E3 ubiquitin-protein ligase UBR2
MSTSRGGGYCDCGDAEAFRAHVHCATHMVAAGAADPLQHFPAGIQTRAKQVFSCVMKYIHEILTTEMVMSLPPDLTFKSSLDSATDFRDWLTSAATSTNGEDRYVVMVYNDEFHTFEEV